MSSAQPIRTNQNPAGDVAPTPQNTPAVHSVSALSRPQIPATLGEEEDGDEDDENLPEIGSGIAGLAGNPAFAAMVQNRLGALVGRSSGYVESLPRPVQHRITGLKGLQAQHAAIEAEFQRAIYELEKSFAEKYRPLYERRRQLVEGTNEPNAEEIQKGEDEEDDEFDEENEIDSDDEDEPQPRVRPEAPTTAEIAAAPKGIPEFWLTALKNHLGLSEIITERDEEALKFLIDLRLEYPADKPGFRLIFEFEAGAKAFFENTKLEKTYYYQDEVGYEGDFVYDHAVGTKIQWKEGKDLTVKVETKRQRNKNTNQTRVVKKVVPTDSFFSFFSPPKPPSDDDDEDEDVDEDIDEKLELDYQIGEDLKERVIPRAIDFFTGKALREEQNNQDYDSEDEFDEEDDEDEDDDDDEDDEEDLPRRGKGGARKAPAPPGAVVGSSQDPQECKQQ